MPNLAGQTAQPIDTANRAIRAWNLIQRSPTSVVIIRGTSRLSAQTVRVEITNGGRKTDLPVGMIGTQAVVVYGVKGHPTVADTDIKRLDRIVINNQEYSFDVIVSGVGEVQAFGTVKS